MKRCEYVKMAQGFEYKRADGVVTARLSLTGEVEMLIMRYSPDELRAIAAWADEEVGG